VAAARVVAAVAIGVVGSRMLLTEILLVALGAIRANKLRSMLTMLGIVIGIAAVITMVALGEGAQKQVQERLQALGTNVLMVSPGQQFFGGVDRGDNRITVDQSRALLNTPQYIKAASPEMSRNQQIEYGGANASTNIVGVWPQYFDINNHQVVIGRFFTDGEERGRRRVAVIGALAGDKIGVESQMLLGREIRVKGIPFEVIGILKEKGSGMGGPGGNQDERIYIPLSTAQYRVIGTDRVNNINVQALGPDYMTQATIEVNSVLRRERRIAPGDPSDFNIRNQASLLNTFEETARTFTFLLAGIAVVSLVVGGIGIMNIMLVSVTERTREIGVRKALGARRRDIMLQFLIESLVLCLAGGVIGLLAGMGGAFTMSKMASWNTAISPGVVAVAIAFSAFVGIFFGLWPARRAAALDPIISLRYE
jgi:putative ABC transport system permease protein